MDTFSSLIHVPRLQPALDRIDVVRELEVLLPQWSSDLQQSFLQIAKYLTGIVVPPVGALPLAVGTPVSQTVRYTSPAQITETALYPDWLAQGTKAGE
jgi:hypothetical protein